MAEDDNDEIQRMTQYWSTLESKCGDIYQISCFADGDLLLEDFYEGKYDIILLDIQMKRMDGMKTAKKIREQDKRVIIIFVTNLMTYALQGYSVKALDFIVKPITYNVFENKMRDVISLVEYRKRIYVFFKTVQGTIVNLDKEEILFVEIRARKLFIHTKEQVYQCNMSLEEVEKKLNDKCFFKCHASVLVNLKNIKEIGKEDVIVGNKSAPVSRHRKKDLIDALTVYISEEA